jgi:site-specific recombinase XerD
MNTNTPIAPHLTAFLRDYLPSQREMSVQTSDTYSYAFQLLVCFSAERLKTTPSALFIEQLDAALVLAFLEHLEQERGNCARTRNSRLAAIKTFFRFLEYRLPSCLEQARRIRAIPVKKTDEKIVGYLNREEIQALLDAPDASSQSGLRDRAMLHLAYAGGLRVSELVGLSLGNLLLHPEATIHVMGKGRRERVLPLWKETAAALRAWLKVRGEPNSTALFLNARGDAMTRSGFEYIIEKHVQTASTKQPSLAKKQVSPHSMRHSCAMHVLQATGDIRKVALWLGHASLQSTEVYLRADPTEKLDAMSCLCSPALSRGRFRPPDKLLAMLRTNK